MARCPREGTAFMFTPNPASRMLYSRGYGLPPAGTVGRVTPVSFGAGTKTCFPGPGGGLIYMSFGQYGIMGVSKYDLTAVRKSKRTLSRGRR